MDEVQYTIPRSWYHPVLFDTEEEAEAYNKERGIPSPAHYSEKLEKWYSDGDVRMNHIIQDGIRKAREVLGITVELSFESSCGDSWATCH